jgi:hypothetical protein
VQPAPAVRASLATCGNQYGARGEETPRREIEPIAWKDQSLGTRLGLGDLWHAPPRRAWGARLRLLRKRRPMGFDGGVRNTCLQWSAFTFPWATETRHYRTQEHSAKAKGHKALGKAFVECHTRHISHGKILVGKEDFAECFISGKPSAKKHSAHLHTQQRINRKNPEKNSKFFFTGEASTG